MSRCQEAISPWPPSFPGLSGGARGPLPDVTQPSHHAGSVETAKQPFWPSADCQSGNGNGNKTGQLQGKLLPLSLGRHQRLVVTKHEPAAPHAPEDLLLPLQAPCEAPGRSQVSANSPVEGARQCWASSGRAIHDGVICPQPPPTHLLVPPPM